MARKPNREFLSFSRPRCLLVEFYRALRGLPPSLECWLERNPLVAQSIKWQFQYGTSGYDIPEANKRAWGAWSQVERNELVAAYEDAWRWLYEQAAPFTNLAEPIVYPPQNLVDTSSGAGSPWTDVSPTYARDLYLRWIGLSLAVEIGGHVPWSVRTYTAEELQVLFDSTSFLSLGVGGNYTVCSGSPGHTLYVHRKDNLGGSLIAPPRFTLAFLRTTNLVGVTRQATIAALLDWCRDNLVHFYGSANYDTMEQHWQYRGLPPITRVISGTTSTRPGSATFEHWTAGCHGTTGFLRNVLRAVNIPVQVVRICGHGLQFFMTEGTYLDHGDNPYNVAFKALGLPASDLLIDGATYTAWFGTNPDNNDLNCGNVGRQVTELVGP